MNNLIYKEIDLVKKNNVKILLNFTGEKYNYYFSAFHFNAKEDKKGFIECYDHFISGRHAIYDDLCLKGAGISSFYKSDKRRSIVGGLSLIQASKEALFSHFFESRGILCSKTLVFGQVNTEHFFCLRKLHSFRLSALDYLKIDNNVSLNHTWETVLKLFSNGIIHTSMNSDNIGCKGELIDCEGFFSTQSKDFVCIPLTFSIPEEDKEIDFSNLESIFNNCSLKYNYLYDIYCTLHSKDLNLKTPDEFKDILNLVTKIDFIKNEDTTIVNKQFRKIRKENLLYIEISLNSIKRKDDLKLYDIVTKLNSDFIRDILISANLENKLESVLKGILNGQ